MFTKVDIKPLLRKTLRTKICCLMYNIHCSHIPIVVHAWTMKAGCPFPHGSGDLNHRKCSNLTGNLGQTVGKYVYLNRNKNILDYIFILTI